MQSALPQTQCIYPQSNQFCPKRSAFGFNPISFAQNAAHLPSIQPALPKTQRIWLQSNQLCPKRSAFGFNAISFAPNAAHLALFFATDGINRQ
jgi:hypothetical protein